MIKTVSAHRHMAYRYLSDTKKNEKLS